MNDKTDRLLEAICHSDRFSDDELEELLRDPDVRKLYDILRKTSEAMAGPQDYDIDREWGEFTANHPDAPLVPELEHDRPRRWTWKMLPLKLSRFFSGHVAAVAILVIVAATVMVAATVGISRVLSDNVPNPEEQLSVSEKPVETALSDMTDTIRETDVADGKPEIVIFKDETFDAIISRICEYYGATATFANQSAKELNLYYKWDQGLPLADVVKELNNFAQINITLSDNVMSIY